MAHIEIARQIRNLSESLLELTSEASLAELIEIVDELDSANRNIRSASGIKSLTCRSTLPTSLLTVLARSAERALGRATPSGELACVKRGPQCGTAGTFLPAIRRRSS